MTTGHKHKELIHAWADGAIIQYKSKVFGDWSDCLHNEPSWETTVEYRIKPEPKPDFSKFTGFYEGDGYNDMCGVAAGMSNIPQVINDEAGRWNLVNKLELIFDGETKELKDVKIHGKE